MNSFLKPNPGAGGPCAKRPAAHLWRWSAFLPALAIALFFACNAPAAYVRFCFTNGVGVADTNYFRVIPISGPVANADGSFTTIGAPVKIVPAANGQGTNFLAANNWFVTNSFLGSGYVIRVPQDFGPTVYNGTALPANDPLGLVISGYNTFVTLTYGTNPPPTADQITNALGYLPEAQSANLDGWSQLGTNLFLPWTDYLASSNSLYGQMLAQIQATNSALRTQIDSASNTVAGNAHAELLATNSELTLATSMQIDSASNSLYVTLHAELGATNVNLRAQTVAATNQLDTQLRAELTTQSNNLFSAYTAADSATSNGLNSAFVSRLNATNSALQTQIGVASNGVTDNLTALVGTTSNDLYQAISAAGGGTATNVLITGDVTKATDTTASVFGSSGLTKITNAALAVVAPYVRTNDNGGGLTNLNLAAAQAGTLNSNAVDSGTFALFTAGGGGGTFDYNSLSNTPTLGTAALVSTNAFDTNGAGTNAIYQEDLSYNIIKPALYGARGDTIKLTNVVTTASSAVITSSGAAFTSNDVGKVFVLYTNSYNSGYIITSISSTNSATSVTLADTVPGTWTNLNARYGSDDTAAIQTAINWAWAGKDMTIKFKPATYMLAGALTNYAPLGASVLYIPSQTYGERRSINLMGASPVVIGSRGLSYALPDHGTVLYCPVRGTNGFNSVLGFNSTDGSLLTLTPEQVTVENISLVLPNNPQLSGINALLGGGLAVRDSQVTADLPYGYNLLGTNRFQAFCDPNSTNAFAGIYYPGVNNPAYSIADNVQVYGFPVGIYAGEHLKVYGGELTINCIGFGANNRPGQSSFIGWRISGTHLANIYNFAISTNLHSGTQYNVNLMASGVDIESPTYFTNVYQVYDPTASLFGFMTYSTGAGDLPTMYGWTSTNLVTWNVADSDGAYLRSIHAQPGTALTLYPGNGSVTIAATNNPVLNLLGRPDSLLASDGYIQGRWSDNRMIARSYLTNGWYFLNAGGTTVLALSDAGVLTANGNGVTNIPIAGVLGQAATNANLGAQIAALIQTNLNYDAAFTDLRGATGTLNTAVSTLQIRSGLLETFTNNQAAANTRYTAATNNLTAGQTALNNLTNQFATRLTGLENKTNTIDADITSARGRLTALEASTNQFMDTAWIMANMHYSATFTSIITGYVAWTNGGTVVVMPISTNVVHW